MSQLSLPPPRRRAAAGSAPTTRSQVLALAVDYAVRAPSVDGTRPWRIELHPDHLVIRADRSRQPAPLDLKGRELVESVGAALFNVRVALAQGGWRAQVERLPRADEPDVLAEVRPVPGPPDGALAVLEPAASRGRGNRRRFTGAHVPDDVLRRLTHIAETEGVVLIPIVDGAHRRLIARLTQRVDDHAHPDQDPEPDPGPDQPMVLLATRTDDELAWLRTGETMQHVLLELTRLDWVASPLTQPIEVPLTRTQLRASLTWNAHPQMLVRIEHAAPIPRPRSAVSQDPAAM